MHGVIKKSVYVRVTFGATVGKIHSLYSEEMKMLVYNKFKVGMYLLCKYFTTY